MISKLTNQDVTYIEIPLRATDSYPTSFTKDLIPTLEQAIAFSSQKGWGSEIFPDGEV
jgi:hypothetical protein